MTRYSVDELDSNWEFKIVRSETGAFRNPEVFNAMLQEESIAGWELVEKLDNRRVRFKRPRDARRRDVTLPPGFDPYRSNYGSGSSPRTLIVAATAIMLVVGGVLAALFVGGPDTEATAGSVSWPGIMIGIVILSILTMAVIVIRRSR